jgi:hypothetical protein
MTAIRLGRMKSEHEAGKNEVTFLAVIFRSLHEYDRVREALATVTLVWQGKVKLIKITIHHVTIKYLVHSIEWGVTARTMYVCGTV